MNKQEIFDRVWDHYVVEGKPRGVRNGRCVYRDPDTGNRCAIGLFMSDELAGQLRGGMPVNQLSYEQAAETFGEGYDMEFLGELQSCHDGSIGEGRFERTLIRFAERWELRVPVLA